MSEVKESLVTVEDTYISDASTSEEVLKDIGRKLLKKGLVKDKFIENILEREKNYPTGLDLTVIDPSYGNIAVPHTEGAYVNVTKVIPVGLTNSVVFNNMIRPKEDLEVSNLFIILNNSPEEQSEILAKIMDFINTLNVDEAKALFQASTPSSLYDVIKNKL
ncbi:PTS sugar transporter subunit IIA [Aerococcaceae bacterium 50-4]